MGSIETSDVFGIDGQNTVCSRESTSNPGKSHETVSVFGESSCGEPLSAQHIRINFTPTDSDNDHSTQKKCVAFWDFIKTSPEIQDLLVLSEPNKYTTVVDSGDYLLEMSKTEMEDESASVDRTALSVLELFEERGLIDPTFDAKLPRSSWCSMGAKDYREHDFNSHSNPAAKKSSAVMSYIKKVSDEGSPIESAYAKHVCKKMEDWDSEHIKSVYIFTISCYAPHPLVLRFVTLWRNVQVVSDCLANLLWYLCCQWCCENRMPMSNTSSVETKPSIEAYKFVDTRAIDAGRSSGEPLLPQHLVVDFSPNRQDTPEAEAKCKKFWQFVNSQEELKDMVVHPNCEPNLFQKMSPESSNARPGSVDEREDYPAVHVLRRMEENGAFAAAFPKSCYRCKK